MCGYPCRTATLRSDDVLAGDVRKRTVTYDERVTYVRYSAKMRVFFVSFAGIKINIKLSFTGISCHFREIVKKKK